MRKEPVTLGDADYEKVADQLGPVKTQPGEPGKVGVFERSWTWVFGTFIIALVVGSVSLGLGVLGENVTLIYLGCASLGLSFVLLVTQSFFARWLK